MKTFGPCCLFVLTAQVACFDSSNTSPHPDSGLPFGIDAAVADGAAPDDEGGLPGDAAAPADAGDGAVVSECTRATGPGTVHQSVNADEIWTAAGSPHTLKSDATIYATLTIEPCAELLLAPGRIVTVRDKGSIVARGTATRRIHIGQEQPGKPFGVIRSLGKPIDLAYVDLEGGGAPGNTNPYLTGALDLQGADASLPTQPLLTVEHVTITGSASNGIALYDGAGFAPASTALTITGSAAYPIGMWSRAVDGVPAGQYTGNTHDEIMLYGQGLGESIYENATMHARGVPYLVGHPSAGGTLYVGKTTGLTTLTIEPGVTVRFKKGGVMYIDRFTGGPAKAALVAAGTAAQPIVFSSDEPVPAAGDWLGLWFGSNPDPSDVIDNARVEYAGGASVTGSSSCPLPGMPPTNPDAAIRIFGAPSSEFVTHTTILDSATHGIDRGYLSDVKQDFLATNTFTGVTLCNETYPADMNNGCPAPASVPCPK